MLRSFSKVAKVASKRSVSRGFSQGLAKRNITSDGKFKVGVVGAAGGIGQPLSLLCKLNPMVSELSLYDVAPVTPGVACDISHINTGAQATGFSGDADQMRAALKDCDLVIVPAGVPRKPGMTRDDLFNINANIVKGIGEAIADACPDAFSLIISNPVNSTVPIMSATLKKAGKYNPKKLFGVTTLDVVRANTFISAHQGMDVDEVAVNVIGGHAGITIVPLLSQVPGGKFSDEDRAALTKRIMFGGDEVVEAKAGGGSATLSMAYAGYRFAERLMRAAAGETGIKECCYVESSITDAQFFASPVTLGPNGVEEVHHFGEVTEYEQELIAAAMPELQSSIKKGIDFVESA